MRAVRPELSNADGPAGANVKAVAGEAVAASATSSAVTAGRRADTSVQGSIVIIAYLRHSTERESARGLDRWGRSRATGVGPFS